MKKSVLLWLGAVALAASVGAAFANSTTIEPSVATADGDVTVYFDWSNANAWKGSTSGIYFRTSDNDFAACTKVTDYVYKHTFNPSLLPHGGFAFRNRNSGHDDDNETKWYNLNNGNVFVITGSQDSGDSNRWYCNVGTADSDAASTVESVAPTGSSYNTKRLWTSAVDLNWWGESTARVGNPATGKAEYYQMTPYEVSAGHTLYFVDVPLNVDYVNIVRKTGLINGWYNISPDVKNNVSNISYIKEGKNIYVDTGGLPGGKADFAGKVLEGYLTCSSSAVNGYGAVQNLKNNFIDQLAEGEKDKMADVNLTDYAYHNTKETYSGSDVKNLTVTAAEKWAAMCALYNAANGTNYSALAMPKERSGSTPTAIVAALTSIGAVAAGAMIFVAKKRKEN